MIDDSKNNNAADSVAGTKTHVEPLCQIVTPVGMLGYGFSEDQTEKALQEYSSWPTPTALVLDSGSTDSGPSKLALGSTTCPRASYVRDLRKLLKLSVRYKARLLISSAGGDGSDEHVDLFLNIIREITEEPDNNWTLKTLAIYSSIPKSLVLDKLHSGAVTGCGSSVPPLTAANIYAAPTIVAQMGPEPLLDAVLAHPDFNVLISGRSYDLAPFVAFAAHNVMKRQGLDEYTDMSPEMMGSISHMGKILECGGLCATPKGQGAQGILNGDASFDIEPLDPVAVCTPLSVAAHTLYEKSRPDILHGPGGYADLTNTTFVQLEDARTVRVRGTVFCLSRSRGLPYTVKLEAAKVTGYRTLTMGSFRDPILISQLGPFLERAKDFVKVQHAHVTEKWELDFHVYGFDQQQPDFIPSEVFVIGESLAESQDVATSLASTLRVHLTHGAYPDQKATSGNFAMGIGGMLELETKQCAEFCVYHLMPIDAGEEGSRELSQPQANADGCRGLFRWKLVDIGTGASQAFASATEASSNGFKMPECLQEMDVQPIVNNVQKRLAEPPKHLVDVAKIVRSKNSGPFEITLDVMFDSMETYQAIKESNILNKEVIAALYNIDPKAVSWCGFFDVAMAFKATIPRMRRGQPSCSGGFLEDDVHGSQQYVPLLTLPLTENLVGYFTKTQ